MVSTRRGRVSIIDPLEARTNRPKKKSRCPTKKISPPTKSFETFNDRLSVDDSAWELVAKNDRRSSRARTTVTMAAAGGAGRGRGHGHPCFLRHLKGRILLSTMMRIVCAGSLFHCQLIRMKATGDHGRRRRRREFEPTPVHLA